MFGVVSLPKHLVVYICFLNNKWSCDSEVCTEATANEVLSRLPRYYDENNLRKYLKKAQNSENAYQK